MKKKISDEVPNSVNQSKKRKCPMIALPDLVGDNVKNRVLTILIAILLYIFLMITIFGSDEETIKTPAEIKIDIGVPANILIAQEISQIRTPKITVYDSDQKPMKGVNVTIQIQNVIVTSTEKKPTCDVTQRLEMKGTLESIRVHDVCKIWASGQNGTSDKDGLISFSNFQIESGPEGVYEFRYAYDNTVKSSKESFFLSSNVYSITVMNSADELTENLIVQLGEPLPAQPKIGVYSETGNPIEGKRVVAFTWPEPEFVSTYGGANYYLQANKFGYLTGTISNPSNSEGIATFDELTIIGSNCQIVYIYFAVDSSITTPFQFPLDLPSEEIIHPPFQFIPIYFIQEVYDIVAISAPSLEVMEGQPFPVQPKIKVMDSNGNPIEGKMVLAVVLGKEGRVFPLLFEKIDQGHKPKEIIRPIAGIYDEDFENPLVENQFTPLLTDSNGEVQFEGLAFNVHGNAGTSIRGQYILGFVCDGIFSDDAFSIQVLSTVTYIEIMENAPENVYISDTSEYDFSILLRISDDDGNGIGGKFPYSFDISYISGGSSDFKLRLRTDLEVSSPSSDDGFFRLYFKVNQLISTVVVKLIIYLDDVSVETEEITISTSQYVNDKACTHISPEYSSYSFELNENVYIKATIENYKGEAITISSNEYYVLYMEIIFDVNSPTKYLPTSFLTVNDQVYDLLDSTSAGEAHFPSMQVIAAPKGKYELSFGVSYSTDSINYVDVPLCRLTEPIILEITSDISTINFSGLDITPGFNNDFTLEVPKEIELEFLDSNAQPVASTDIDISVIPTHLPPSYFALMEPRDKSDWQVMDKFFDWTSPVTTDASGVATFSITIKKGFMGNWGISLVAGGGHSASILFKTNFPANSIEIITQPASSGDYVLVGNPIDTQPVVKVLDSNGDPVENAMVVGAFEYNEEKVKEEIIGMIDAYSNSAYSSFYGLFVTLYLNDGKNTQTDSSGLATFQRFGIGDLTKDGCFRFVFAVGAQEQYILSEPSDEICFKNNFEFEITNTFSIEIAENQNFVEPPKIKVTRSGTNNLDSFLFFSAQVLYTNKEATQNPQKYSRRTLANNFCEFYQHYIIEGGCTDLTIINDGSGTEPFVAEFEFTNMQWVRPSVSTEFQLGFGTFFYLPTIGQSISVENSPSTIEIIEQPPDEITIGEIVTVSVKAMIGNGSPLSRAYISANITKNYSLNSVSSFGSSLDSESISLDNYEKAQDAMSKESLLNLFGQAQFNIDTLASIAANDNVIIAEERANEISNNDGIAMFHLKFISGKPGSYVLIFQSGRTKSQKSNVFTLKNPINIVTIKNSLSQTIKANFERDSELKILPSIANFKILPILELFEEGEQPSTELIHYYKLAVVKKSDVEEAKANLKTDTPSLADISSSTNFGDESAASDKINRMWNIISNGADLLGSYLNKDLGLKVNCSIPIQSENQIQFEYLEIEFPKPGEYQLIAVIDGIESERSDIIVVEDKNETVTKKVIGIFEYILIYGICILVCLTNLTYASNILSALSILGTSVAIGVLSQTERGTFFLAMSMICLCFLWLNLIYVFIINMFFQTRRPFSLTHEDMKNIIFKEYTYQLLFKRPSNAWMTRILTKKQISKQEEEKNWQNLTNRMIESNGSTFSLPDEAEKLDTSVGLFRKETQIKSINKSTFEKQINFSNENLRLKEKWLSIFRPFLANYRKTNLKNMFYFPQRFLAALFIGILSLIVIIVTSCSYLESICDKIGDLKVTVHQTVYSFANNAAITALIAQRYDVSNEDLQPFFTVITEIDNNFDDLIIAIRVAFMYFKYFIILTRLASIFSVLAFLFSFFKIVFDFRDKILKIRKGEFPYIAPRTKFPIMASLSFGGCYISNCILGYILILFLMMILFTPFCFPLFWEYLLEIILFLLLFILPAIIKRILTIILNKTVATATYVKYRSLLSIFDTILFYLGILSGMVTALMRFVIMILVMVLGSARLDKPLYPNWILQKMWLDKSNKSYIGMLLMHNNHNHPVLVSMANIFLQLPKVNNNSIQIISDINQIHTNDLSSKKKLRIRNKFHLLRLLIRNPQLAKFRKNRIQDPSLSLEQDNTDQSIQIVKIKVKPLKTAE